MHQKIDEPDITQPIIAPRGLVIVTLDDSNVARLVGKKLSEAGYEVAYVCMPYRQRTPKNAYRLKDNHFKSIQKLYEVIMENTRQPLTGFIHISDVKTNLDNQNVTGIFDVEGLATTQAVYGLIKYFGMYAIPPKEGVNFAFTITRMDGAFGLSEAWTGKAMQAGLFGLQKALCREWEQVFCRVVDITAKISANLAAKMIFNELRDSQMDANHAEVARDQHENRYLLARVPEKERTFAQHVPTNEDVFVVTGGARSVTFACVHQLGKTYGTKFILLGRSNIDQSLEWAKGATEPAAVQALFLEEMKQKGLKLTPKEMTQRVAEAVNQLTIENNLRLLEESGIQAVYYACDICEASAVQQAIADGQAKLGQVTGLIHGAGVLRDRPLLKKSEDDFQTVIMPKIIGFKHCIEAIQPEKLRYLCAFSSTAAVLGNPSQTDYALANEILNKSLAEWKKVYPHAFSLSMNWGPWQGGMMSEMLQQVLDTNGGKAIPMAVGAKHFAQQFAYAFEKNTTQIMISDRPDYIAYDFRLADVFGNVEAKKRSRK